MTTATTVPTAQRILAIDLGKYKSVACNYHADTGEVAFATLDTSRAELPKLFTRRRPDVVVIEACALSGWVHDLCGELGLACRVANTAGDAWKFRHAKRNTDRDDARRLAQLEALHQLPAVSIPPKPITNPHAPAELGPPQDVPSGLEQLVAGYEHPHKQPRPGREEPRQAGDGREPDERLGHRLGCPHRWPPNAERPASAAARSAVSCMLWLGRIVSILLALWPPVEPNHHSSQYVCTKKRRKTGRNWPD